MSVADAEAGLATAVPAPNPLFNLERDAAAEALRDPEGAIKPITPFSDADELHRLFESALGVELITCEFESAYISIYPMAIGHLEPLPAVEVGGGVVILGPAISLRQADGEDPIAYTLRIMEETVSQANALSARFGQAERRLDRIADFMTRRRPWSGGDVCEFVERELRASGRPVPDHDG